MTNAPEQSRESKPQILRDELFMSPKIVLRKDSYGGYGVFARERISKGELIEVSPYVPSMYRSKDLVHVSLRRHCWPEPCDCEMCKIRGRQFMLCSGYLQMYNSSMEKEGESVSLKWVQEARVIEVVTTKKIPKDGELFLYYGEGYINALKKSMVPLTP
jgi:hypothetical protein